jgi:hypothetical protein
MTDGDSPSGVHELDEREPDAEETSPAEADHEDELDPDASTQEGEAEGGEEGDEADAEELDASETDADKDEAAPADAPVLADDTHVIEWTDNGETHQATVADLKRLAGQESSLTRRSQSLAEQTQLNVNYGAQYRAFLTGRRQILESRLEPYANVDWEAAIRDSPPETVNAARADIAAVQQELSILDADANSFLQQEQEFRRQELLAKAPEVQAILQHEIPNWGDARYNQLRAYAQSQGLPQTEVDMIIHPGVLKMIDKALRWDDAMKARTKGRPKPKSAAKASPKARRAASRLPAGTPKGTPALDRQRESALTHRRNTEETAAAFEEQILARDR